jgi:hypothetical protein
MDKNVHATQIRGDEWFENGAAVEQGQGASARVT